jgi:hypothetical protein
MNTVGALAARRAGGSGCSGIALGSGGSGLARFALRSGFARFRRALGTASAGAMFRIVVFLAAGNGYQPGHEQDFDGFSHESLFG